MSAASSALQEQFAEMPQQRQAATLGLWAFLATEVLFFGALFLAYTVCRHLYPQAFAQASHHTLIVCGTLNTAILLTSSLTMALAVNAARTGARSLLLLFLGLTIFLALAFMGVKAIEYWDDIKEHLWPGPHFRAGLPRQAQLFWFLYWVMTGVHALHVTAGIGVLAVLTVFARRNRFSPAYYTPVEMTGLYWHFVDIVWIFLYPMLYLVQRANN